MSRAERSDNSRSPRQEGAADPPFAKRRRRKGPRFDRRALAVYRRLLGYLRPYRWIMVGAVLCTGGFAAVAAGFPAIMSAVTERLQAPEEFEAANQRPSTVSRIRLVCRREIGQARKACHCDRVRVAPRPVRILVCGQPVQPPVASRHDRVGIGTLDRVISHVVRSP